MLFEQFGFIEADALDKTDLDLFPLEEAQRMRALRLHPYPSVANFVLVKFLRWRAYRAMANQNSQKRLLVCKNIFTEQSRSMVLISPKPQSVKRFIQELHLSPSLAKKMDLSVRLALKRI